MNQKCSLKLFLIYAYECTTENPNFTFTSKELSEHFGCSKQSAMHILKRIKAFSYTIQDGRRNDFMVWKLNESGMSYGRKLKQKLDSGVTL